jgi:inositol-1,3,4-trisphosphate 5/6-kinase/inositol-tetrakisphosphate 1-kinase
MRVHGEVSGDEEAAAAAGEPVPLTPPPASAAQQRLVVGYALTKKKVKSFLQPKLLALAR